MQLRAAAPGDFAAIQAIYRHHVLHGLASFEEVPPDVEELRRRHADIVISFRPGRDPAHLDAQVLLCDTLLHPDITPLLDGEGPGPVAERHERGVMLRIPGNLDPERAAALEEAVWERMAFASHLRIRRLGEFTVGILLILIVIFWPRGLSGMWRSWQAS